MIAIERDVRLALFYGSGHLFAWFHGVCRVIHVETSVAQLNTAHPVLHRISWAASHTPK